MNLVIPPTYYDKAATIISNERLKFDKTATKDYVLNVLRAYTRLGQAHTIADYGTGWQKNNEIIARLQKEVGENDYNRMKSILDFMEIYAANGQVFPSIARPNFAQTQFDAMLQAGHKNDPTTSQIVAKGVHDFFGFTGSLVSDVTTPAISGLWSGLSTPMKVVLVGGALTAGYIFLKPYLK